MDRSSVKIRLQTYWVRLRAWTSFVASALYIGLFLAGVYTLGTGTIPILNDTAPSVTVGEFAVSGPVATVGVAIGLVMAGVALMFRSRKGSHTVIGDRVD